MTTEKVQPVLRRKAAAGAAPAGGARRAAMTPLHALELALARAAQEELGLALAAGDPAETAPGVAEIEAEAGGQALIAVLDGPAGATGLMVLSAPFLAAVVTCRMTGQLPLSPPPERAPTRIDAEMARDLIDRVLAEFEARLADGADAGWATGFRYRGYLADPRLVRFSLPDIAWRGFRLEAVLGDGAMRGEVFLALPAAPARSAAPDRPAGGDPAGRWSEALRGNILGSRIVIDAVLTRLRLPLARLSGLRPGDTLPLPRQALDAVRMEGAGRALLATGRLGQLSGDRAVRLHLPATVAPADDARPGDTLPAPAAAEDPPPALPAQAAAG